MTNIMDTVAIVMMTLAVVATIRREAADDEIAARVTRKSAADSAVLLRRARELS